MKKISMFLVLVLTAFVMNAQVLPNKSTDNWFMSLAGGTNMYFGSGSTDATFIDSFGWESQLAVGRWNSPKWGARLAINVGQHKHYNLQVPFGDTYTIDSFVHPHIDLLWNVTGVNRTYNFIPYIGVGYIYGLDKDFKKINPGAVFKGQNQSLTWNLGIINDVQLSKNFSIFLDLSATTLQNTYGRNYTAQPQGDYEWDIIAQALLGVKFGLGGKQDFTNAELMDYDMINDLNGRINDLRQENELLSKRPEFCPECPEVEKEQTITTNVYVPSVVFFKINSAVIDKPQQINIYNTAEYLKENKNAKVQIVAYADKQTGNSDYNLRLSEKRAKAVHTALTNQYNIDSNRITIDWKGDSEQPFTENDWNRVAIFIVE